MADDRLDALLGGDPKTSLGFLVGCTVLSPVAGVVYESNVVYTAAEPLPVGLEWIPYSILYGSLLASVCALAGYHVAANRGYGTTGAGAVVALYGVAFSVAPISVGSGFPPSDATVVERAAQAAHLALVVGGVLAVIGALGGLAARRVNGAPEGRLLASIGGSATGPLRIEARPRVVVLVLLVIASAGTWAAVPPQGSFKLPCADPPSFPEVDAQVDDDLVLTYEHGCALPASSFVVTIDGERATWAERDPDVSQDQRIVRGQTLAVGLPPDAFVELVYVRPGTDDVSVIGYWNTSE